MIPNKEQYRAGIVPPHLTIVLHANEVALVNRIRRRKSSASKFPGLELDRIYQQAVDQRFWGLDAIHVDTSDRRCCETVELIKAELAEHRDGQWVRHASIG